MGDRGNIVIGTPDNPGIFLYTHWTGTEIPATLQAALKRGRGRWDDDSYLARIVFCEMVGAENFADTTGFGISTNLCDNEHPLLFVDCAAQRVHIGEAPDRTRGVTARSWSFAEYIEIAAPTWNSLQGKSPDD